MSFRGPKTIGVVWLTTILGPLSAGQNLPAPSPPWASHMPTVSRESDDSQALERQRKIRFSARQKQLMADTAKLVALIADLKVQVDRSAADTWSVDTIRKANEIEKLARSVKKRLKE